MTPRKARTATSISIAAVIPVYNGERYLSEAIDGVLAQTLQPEEIIIVDDGSTDRTPFVLQQYASRHSAIRVLRQDNLGVSTARNRGIRAASRDWVAFLDADDVWLPTKLETQARLLAVKPKIIGVGGRMQYLGKGGPLRGVVGEVDVTGVRELIATARLMPFQLSSFVARRDLLLDVGGFDPELHAAEDIDLVARMANAGPLETIPRPVGYYRLHISSTSHRAAFLSQRRAIRYVRSRLEAMKTGRRLTWSEYEEMPLSLRQKMEDRAMYYLRGSATAWAEGKRARALVLAGGALMVDPAYTVRRLARKMITSPDALARLHGR